MNLSTSSSNFRHKFHLYRFIWRPVIVCLFLVTLYQTLVAGSVVPSSNGINQWQFNLVKAERYIYDTKSDIKLAIIGSSIANRIQPEYISPNVANLAMSALSSQIGLEIIKRSKLKPSLVLVETNETIYRGLDTKTIDYLYHPLFYFIRSYFSIFRQEYQPVSVIINYVKTIKENGNNSTDKDLKQIGNPRVRQSLIAQLVQLRNKPLTEELENKIRIEAEKLKVQIAEMKKEGVRVVLFNIPGEPGVEETIQVRQINKLIEGLFPKDSFEWLPKPLERNWVTDDGIHLIDSNAKKYGIFLRKQLLALNPELFAK